MYKLIKGCTLKACRRRAAARLTLAVALSLLLACTARAPLLNSERIAREYGSYAVRILAASDDERISSLESRERARPVTRTLAIVWFMPAARGALAQEHARIVAGASIGTTFHSAGWSIEKALLHIDELSVASPAVAALMQLPPPQALAMHAYRFDVRRDGDSIPYATIVELHHPEYLARADLVRLYGGGAARTPPAPRSFEQRVLQRLATLSPQCGERRRVPPPMKKPWMAFSTAC